MKPFRFFLLVLIPFLMQGSHATAQRLAFGVRGTNLLANQFGGPNEDGVSYSSRFTMKPELNRVYFADQTGFPDYYYRYTAVQSVYTTADLGWFARLDWYLRYYHKEKWFIHYSAYRRDIGVRANVNWQTSSTPDFANASSSKVSVDFNFNKIRTLMYGHYLGKPRLGQFYALGGLTLAKAGPNGGDGVGMDSPDKQIPALRGGAGVRYKGVMLEVFLERSITRLKTTGVNENNFQSPPQQWGRYTWFDINLSIDLVSFPIKSRKTAREVNDIRNSW